MGRSFVFNDLRLDWQTNKHEDFLTPLEWQNASI
jgi:hypothetical protein